MTLDTATAIWAAAEEAWNTPNLDQWDIDVWAAAATAIDPPPPSPYQADPVGWIRHRLGEHLWSKQRTIAESVRDNRYTAVQSCHDAGKARPLTALVPTPTGWATMGGLRPGDQVIDEQGQPCTVVAKSPIWRLPCFRVEFDDGTVEIVNGAHEWTVLDLRHRRRKIADWRDHWADAITMTTDRIRGAGLTVGGQRRWRIPLSRPLDLPDANLSIDPYVLGAWLGDGTSIRPEITCHPDDREIVDRIAALGERVRRRGTAAYAWALTGRVADRPLLTHRLSDLGVLGNKHIPTVYLRASISQRVELLRGLMDTDGFNARGSVGIDLTNERLAQDVAELIRSLGWKVTVRKGRATCNGVECGVRYRLCWRTDINPFHLARKAEAWQPRAVQGSAHTLRTIVAIEPTEPVDTVCIEVDSPRHLYLAGEAMVPTHNSFVASRLVAWWLDVHPHGTAFAVTTAPTAPQVSAILWREIRRAHRKGALAGHITQGAVPEWKLPGGEQIGYGRKPADEDQAAFQGIHALYPLIVIDEACGVPKNLFDAVDALATNEHARVLAIGNPDDPSSHFAQVCRPGSGWNVIRIDGLETPNMTAEALAEHRELADLFQQLGLGPTAEVVPGDLRPLLLSPLWVWERIKRWGIGSPIFAAKVRGLFPEIGHDTLITPAMIRAAQERTLDPGPHGILGVDVARFGMDRTVIVLRRGGVVRVIGEYSKLPTTQTTGHVIEAKRTTGAQEIRVDGVGVGGGVVDQLVEGGHDVLDMQAGAAAVDNEHFKNARAEWYWALRQRFEQGDVDLDPDDDETAAQLGAMRYQYTARGQVQIESKDEMKKRGLPSPDRADAMMLTAAAAPPPDVPFEDDEDDDFQISQY